MKFESEMPILRSMNLVYESKKRTRERERRRKRESGECESDEDNGDIYLDTLSAEDWYSAFACDTMCLVCIFEGELR